MNNWWLVGSWVIELAQAQMLRDTALVRRPLDRWVASGRTHTDPPLAYEHTYIDILIGWSHPVAQTLTSWCLAAQKTTHLVLRASVARDDRRPTAAARRRLRSAPTHPHDPHDHHPRFGLALGPMGGA